MGVSRPCHGALNVDERLSERQSPDGVWSSRRHWTDPAGCHCVGNISGILQLDAMATRRSFADSLLGFAVVIAAQPILGGPAVTGHDITRLVLLGLPAILLALAVILPHTSLSYRFWQQALPFCMVTVAAGSFHHTYSFLGIRNGADRTVQFALVHFGCGILLLLALRALAVKEHRQRDDSYYPFLDGSLRHELKNGSPTNALGTSKGKTCL